MSTSRMAVSVHLLAYLAFKGSAATSAELAGSVGSHPVALRRLLASLRKGKLVTAHKGATGGFNLGSRPEQITLLDVYRLVEPERSTELRHFSPNGRCPVGGRIGKILEGAFFKAQAGMEAELQRVTIADVERQLRTVCGSRQ